MLNLGLDYFFYQIILQSLDFFFFWVQHWTIFFLFWHLF